MSANIKISKKINNNKRLGKVPVSMDNALYYAVVGVRISDTSLIHFKK